MSLYQCDAESLDYGGRYFKTLDFNDIQRLNGASEWEQRKDDDIEFGLLRKSSIRI